MEEVFFLTLWKLFQLPIFVNDVNCEDSELINSLCKQFKKHKVRLRNTKTFILSWILWLKLNLHVHVRTGLYCIEVPVRLDSIHFIASAAIAQFFQKKKKARIYGRIVLSDFYEACLISRRLVRLKGQPHMLLLTVVMSTWPVCVTDHVLAWGFLL